MNNPSTNESKELDLELNPVLSSRSLNEQVLLRAKRPNHPDLAVTTANDPRVPECYGLIAVGADKAFGLGKGLPWKNSTDMIWFKHLTMGKVVAVSQKTLDTIPNGLPGRLTNILKRGVDVTFPHHFDMFFIGGKLAFLNNLHNMDGIYVTIIPGTHQSDIQFDIDEILKAGFSVDFMGTTTSVTGPSCLLVSFVNERNLEPLKRSDHKVSQYFEPYLKLTAKKHVNIKPGAHGTIEVNEKVYTPKGQIGIFDVRKKYADKGLYTSGVTFKREWIGVPTITVTNRGTTEIDFYPGEEVGEISFVQLATI